ANCVRSLPMATRLKDQTGFQAVPLSPAIGIEIRGLDFKSPVDAATQGALRRLWADNSILLVRDLDFSEDDQFRFARMFGEIADRVQPPVERHFRADPFNKMQLVTDRVDEDGKPVGSLGHGEMWFHTDKCY